MEEQIINLLIVSEQHAKPNRLLSKLRDDGISLKAMGVGSEAKAIEQIDKHLWDLIICFECEDVPVKNILHALQQGELDTPLIFIPHIDSTVEALPILTLGARDVVSDADEERVLFCLKREITSYQLAKQNRKLELKVKELELRHHLLLDIASNPLSYVQDGMHLYCNQSYADLFSYENIEDISATSLLDLLTLDDRDFLKQLLEKTLTQTESISVQAQGADGKQFAVEMTFTPVSYKGNGCLQLCVQAVSGNIEYTEKKEKLQSQDLLTRLYKKSFFMGKIEDAIANAIQHDTLSSLIIIQVNEFVDIKSTIGKSNTNMMINDIGQFLQKSIKKSFSAARLDDYIFALLLDDSSPREAIEMASFIKGKINNHITTTALPSLQLSCSIGIAAINDHALDAEDLLSRARVNLNTTVDANQSMTEFRISDSLDHKVDDMISYLSLALKQNRFKLLFQPLVNLKGNGSDGYEVLTRMLDSDGNDIPPNSFIPLANLNGMGEEIDKTVLQLAMDQLQEKQQSPHKFIITITNNSLVSPTFLPWLSEQLQQRRINADLLVFQISEIDICNSLDHAAEFCAGLDELGIQKTVCHFGCVINPLEYLDTIQANYVKLDRTIIRDIAYSSHQKSSVQDLIKSLHDKGFMVVAPQIEDVDLLPLLWEIGADFVQGYCLQGPSQEMNYEFIQNQEITLNAPDYGAGR
jgi:multidomain signaling protein FimX